MESENAQDSESEEAGAQSCLQTPFLSAFAPPTSRMKTSYLRVQLLQEGALFHSPKVGSCLTLGKELFKETHMLTKQEMLLERAPGQRAVG